MEAIPFNGSSILAISNQIANRSGFASSTNNKPSARDVLSCFVQAVKSRISATFNIKLNDHQEVVRKTWQVLGIEGNEEEREKKVVQKALCIQAVLRKYYQNRCRGSHNKKKATGKGNGAAKKLAGLVCKNKLAYSYSEGLLCCLGQSRARWSGAFTSMGNTLWPGRFVCLYV